MEKFSNKKENIHERAKIIKEKPIKFMTRKNQQNQSKSWKSKKI